MFDIQIFIAIDKRHNPQWYTIRSCETLKKALEITENINKNRGKRIQSIRILLV